MLKSFKKTALSISCFVIAVVGLLAVNFFNIEFISPIYFVIAGIIIGVISCIIPKLERKGGEEK